MEKKLYLYEALIYPSGNGFEVYFPDLDQYTQGDDFEDAARMAYDLAQTWVSYLVESGREVPAAEFGHEVPVGGKSMIFAVKAPEPETAEMSVEDAAGVLGVSKARVYAMVKDGVLEGRKVGSSVLVSAASVKKRQNAPRKAGRPVVRTTEVMEA